MSKPDQALLRPLWGAFLLFLFAGSAHALNVLGDPGSLTAYRGKNGSDFYFVVKGTVGGSVWGTDIYTDDSTLAAAAVHAGALAVGKVGLVKVTILPGQASYAAATRNGVTSADYGSWSGSYKVAAWTYDGSLLTAPVKLMPWRGLGGTYKFSVTGNAKAGSVWGSDIYTDDSVLAAAAVHAGVVADGATAVVAVTLLDGQGSYAGSTRNGVTSSSYGAWSGSFSFGTSGPTSDVGRFYRWAEKTYPYLFAPAKPTDQVVQDYAYRYYPDTATYLGIKGGTEVFYSGPYSDNKMLDLGTLDSYLALIPAGF